MSVNFTRFIFQAEEELYGAHAQPQKPLMKAGASVIESAESGIELSASAQSGTWSDLITLTARYLSY